MDRSAFILNNLGIHLSSLGKVYTFVDFGNVNRWFDKDQAPFQGKRIEKEQKIIVNIEKLGRFIDLFSKRKFFYYGFHPQYAQSMHIKILADRTARFTSISKPIQKIKHYLSAEEHITQGAFRVNQDQAGDYIYIYKCNFDVEIAVDALRLVTCYDTFVLFSSDRDFVVLLNHLKKSGKKIILFYSGPTAAELKQQADILVNGQQIRELIGTLKE